MLQQKRYTPKMVVEEKISFAIPLYQRLFAWGEEQINGLMTDLKEHFLKDETAETPYYLGLLTVVEQDSKYSLIDGQQRCTVMTLFAIALLKKEKELGIVDAEWEKFVSNGSRLEFKGRKADNESIKYLACGGTLGEELNQKMDSAISLMKYNMPTENLADFARRVYTNLSFFFAELDASYVRNPSSLNKYFEAMNSTGKGLEQHEILKVDLLKNQEDQELLTRIWNIVSQMSKPVFKAKENHEERQEYNSAMDLCRRQEYAKALDMISQAQVSEEGVIPSIDTIKPSDKVPGGREYGDASKAIISFPKFLLMVLDLIGNNTTQDVEVFYRTANLITTFKNNRPSDIKKFYGEMLYYRLLLDYYCVHLEYSQGASHYELLYRDEDTSDTEEATRLLRQYLAMLDVSTIYYLWLKDYLKAIHDNTTPRTSSALLSLIKTIDNSNEKHLLPDDLSEMTYMGLQRRRYVFWRLDYYLYERRKDLFKKKFPLVNMVAINNYEFRENRSIEHLHPQNEDKNKAWVNYDLNNFGNLAMISQSFNSEQSNDPVDVKFARIKDQAKFSGLQSLKLYLMYLKAGANPEGWDEETAAEHGEEMYNLLKETYEHKG